MSKRLHNTVKNGPAQEAGTAAPLGLQLIVVGVTCEDHLLHVPETYQTTRPTPLILWLHGAGGAPANS
jgi:phospholipase/carboxylesterase